MRPAQELITDLRSGHTDPSELDWHEFQEVVFYLISERLRLQLPNTKVSFSDHDRGVIDIILEYSTLHPTLQSTAPDSRVEKCFIECKRYTRHIELDSAAKAFCAAIHQRPARLCLVTLNGLSPQAWDYARHFFRTEEADDHALTQVSFDHVQLATLLGIATNPARSTSVEGNGSVGDSVKVLDWQIVEQGTFYRQVIASAVHHPTTVRLQHRRSYALRVWLSRPQSSLRKELQVSLRGSGGTPDPRFFDTRVVAASATQVELEADIAVTEVARSQSTGDPLTFALRLGRDLAGVQEPFPHLHVEPSSTYFPDLREQETAALAKRLADSHGDRIVFVSGEGGIGKSYLCQRAADLLVHEHGYLAHAFSVLAASEHLVLRIVLSLLRPRRSGGPASEPVLRDLLNAWVAADVGVEWASTPENGTAEASLPAVDDSVIVGIGAELLADSHVPRLLYVQNCQDLSPQEIKTLALLLAELDSKGWGRLRLLLEYRTENESTSDVWQTFVRNALVNLHPCGQVVVRSLESKTITDGVAAAFVTDDPAHIADVLLEKAGGNPLYLTQVVQHLVDLGACRAVQMDDGGSSLVVHDQALLSRKLRALPDQLTLLLRSRLQQYVSANQDHPTYDGTPVPEYLALLAAAGPGFERPRMAQALEVSDERLVELEWRLVHDQFLVQSEAGTGVDFVHDLMRLAAAAAGREAAGFAQRAERLEGLLDREIDREALVGGTLNLWLQRFARALWWFETAFERAQSSGDFSLQREALLGSGIAAEALPARTLQDKLKRIELSMALGWNEMQTGSQNEAVRVYQAAYARGQTMLRYGNVEEHRLWRREEVRIRHAILTCLVHLQAIDEAVRLLDRMLPAISDVERLFHVLNRYLLICFAGDLPRAGWRASRIACGLADILEPECVSVIMSDIGHLYMVAAPERTQELWLRGRDTAQALRQRTHSRANVLIAGFLTRNPEPASEFENLLRTVIHNGISGQLTRLFMYAGVCAAREAQWDQAHHWFEKAVNNARACNQVVYEWQASNNLGVATLVMGESELAVRHFSVAAALVAPLWEGWDRSAGEGLAERFESHARQLCPAGKLHHLEVNYVSTWSPPALTTPSWYLLYNLERLQKDGLPLLIPLALRDAIAGNTFRAAANFLDDASHPLAVQTRHERLSLAIE